ncbi:MAG: glutamate 5-kinase [Candidatus Zapsychrus exili]|nr:glutamate 5-kinase [Candidatus Zapsychrus exili]
MYRKFPRKIKRIVIKVGSSVIATYAMKPRSAQLKSLAAQISVLQRQGIEVVLVSSGAIVLGMGEMKLKKRPSSLAALQALAAIGQNVLMRKYNDFFKAKKMRCAQVLLTWDDFDNRERYNNARNTFKAILEQKVVPIVNENDTISTDEIKFGDNDKLSALVASLIDADLLLILSDVEGFYEIKTDGRKKVICEIKEITKEIERMATPSKKKEMSKGGMSAKLEAIKIATHAKIPAVIAHGEIKNVLSRVLKGERIGTLFVEKEEKLISRKHWISFGAKPKGIFVVDDGAKKALLRGGTSLLLVGVSDTQGTFKKGEVVVVSDKNGHEIARGISNYSTGDIQKIEEKQGKQEAIHCDNMVLSKR